MRRTLLYVALIAGTIVNAHAQKNDWLGTWTTADMLLPPATDPSKALPIGRKDVTLRQVVHISQGGKRVRITFSNEFGTTPLRISAAHLAFLSTGSKILPETDHALTFAGQPGTTIAPGQFVSTDPVTERVPIFSDLVISTAIPAQNIPNITYHAAAHTTTFIAPGEQTAALEFISPLAPPPGLAKPDVAAAITPPLGEKPIVESTKRPQQVSSDTPNLLARTTSWYFLKNVEVDSTRKSAAIVTLGDSITDGTGTTLETNRRWPDVMAPLLAAGKKTAALSVLNVGIGGNRILHEGTGPSALDRLDRDVLTQPGARYVIILEGINDIGNIHRAPADMVTEQQLMDGMTTIASRAHAKGLKVIAATVLPYAGAKYFSPDGEAMRQHLNDFIRKNSVLDGFIDFDAVTRDPAKPDTLLGKYDSGDHLHPSDMGYAAMGAAVNLKLFRK